MVMGQQLASIVATLFVVAGIVFVEIRYGFGAGRLLKAVDADKSEFTAPARGGKPRSRTPVFQNSLASFMDSSFSSDAGLACTPLDDLSFAVRADPYNFENFYKQKNTSKAVKKAMRKAAQEYFKEMTTFGIMDVKGGEEVFLDANASEFKHSAGQRGARNCRYSPSDFPHLNLAFAQQYLPADDTGRASCYRRTELMGAGIATNWSKGCQPDDFKAVAETPFHIVDSKVDGKCANATRFLEDITFKELIQYVRLYKQLLTNAGNLTDLMPKAAQTKCNLQTEDHWHESCLQSDFLVMPEHTHAGNNVAEVEAYNQFRMTIEELAEQANFDAGSAQSGLPLDVTGTSVGEGAEVPAASISKERMNNVFTAFIGRESCYIDKTKTQVEATLQTAAISGLKGVGKVCGSSLPDYNTNVDGNLQEQSCVLETAADKDFFIGVRRTRWSGCFSTNGTTEHNLFWNFLTNAAYLAKTQGNAAMCRRNLLVQSMTRGHAEIYDDIKASDSPFNLHDFYEATSGPPLRRGDVGTFAAGSTANQNKGDQVDLAMLYGALGFAILIPGLMAAYYGIIDADMGNAMMVFFYVLLAGIVVLACVTFAFDRSIYYSALRSQRAPLDVMSTCSNEDLAKESDRYTRLFEDQSLFSIIMTPIFAVTAAAIAYRSTTSRDVKYTVGIISNLMFIALFSITMQASQSAMTLAKADKTLSNELRVHCDDGHVSSLKENHGLIVTFSAIPIAVSSVLIVLAIYAMARGKSHSEAVEYVENYILSPIFSIEMLVWIAMLASTIIVSIVMHGYNKGLLDISILSPVTSEERMNRAESTAQDRLASTLVTFYPIMGILWLIFACYALAKTGAFGEVTKTVASMGRFM